MYPDNVIWGKPCEFAGDDVNHHFANIKRDGILKFELWEAFDVLIYTMLILVVIGLDQSLRGRGRGI